MSRSETSERTREVRVRRRRRPGFGFIALILVLLALAYAILQAAHALPHWLNPFGETTKDRSAPVVLQSIQNLSRYESASGNFQVVVDLEKDARFLPGALRGQRTVFVGSGSVDAVHRTSPTSPTAPSWSARTRPRSP